MQPKTDQILTKLKTKPLTEAEQAYFGNLNDEAQAAYQRHLEAQQRLAACLAFLRDQHDAPEDGWGLKDLSIGFVEIVESLTVAGEDVASDIEVEKE